MSHLVASLTVLLVLPATVWAQLPWQFGQPVEISGAAGSKTFHHLESSGRRNIAVSGQVVAITWEDDRDGVPRVYLSRKRIADKGFEKPVQISQQGEAYEPSITPLTNDRFAVAWEESGHVMLRLVGPGKLGPVARLSQQQAGQVNLASSAQGVVAVYAEHAGRHRRIMLVQVRIQKDGQLSVGEPCVVDPEPHRDEQLYPVVVNSSGEQVIAWEDRRPGHTIIMAAYRTSSEGCRFPPPQRISAQPAGRAYEYGKGHGVARAALAAYGKGHVFAAWADKRDFREGYDIYGAGKPAAGGFGANQKLQDDFGEVARQWHVALAGHANGQLVAAWDDEREGNTDILLSWWNGGVWSEDYPVPGAAGAGEQGHVTLVLDDAGNLHLAWVEREQVGAPTRLRYMLGKAVSK